MALAGWRELRDRAGPTTGASSAESTSAGCHSPRRRSSTASGLDGAGGRSCWAVVQPEGLAAVVVLRHPGCRHVAVAAALLCTLVLGLVGTGFAYMLQFDVVRGAGPVIGSTITYRIPVVSVLLGVLVLGERLGPWQVVGFVVVLGAAFVINRRPRPAAEVVRRCQGVAKEGKAEVQSPVIALDGHPRAACTRRWGVHLAAEDLAGRPREGGRRPRPSWGTCTPRSAPW